MDENTFVETFISGISGIFRIRNIRNIQNCPILRDFISMFKAKYTDKASQQAIAKFAA
jgi:hypothetical protein